VNAFFDELLDPSAILRVVNKLWKIDQIGERIELIILGPRATDESLSV
jgi:hypothetical protein